jgi:hypothetical protein
MHPDFRERLHAAIAAANARRGRPLTDRERLDNLAAWLADNTDDDGLDPIEALVADAASEEACPMLHEAGEYYAERIIKRAIAQGTLVLASVDTLPEGQDAQQGLAGTESGAVGATGAETPNPGSTPETGLVEARDALQAMMDAWFDYHDAHSLTQPVTGAAGHAFEKALAARDMIDTALSNVSRLED